jgi:glycosyltransferase involved in cell wall biosynthesis
MTKPLVAIYTPVYNGAKFIENAIKTVLAQTYKPIVHVIVDNACTDGTDEIIARYIAQGANIIVKRNPETVPQVENFNLAVEMVPGEAKYMRLMCADDGIPPTAIERMVEAAESVDNVIMVGGIERVNGVQQPHHFPPESTVFESSNAIARWFADYARIPMMHILTRTDTRRQGVPYYNTEVNSADTDMMLRVLSQGGRYIHLHEPIGDTTNHPGTRRETLDARIMTIIWEHTYYAEIYGAASLSNSERERVRRSHLRVMYRRLLFWNFSKPDLAKRDYGFLKARGLQPSLGDYLDALFFWPEHVYIKRFSGMNLPKPWPDDAVRPGT